MEKKEQILKLLKRVELSESRIAFEIKVNQNYAKKYLNELKDENKVKVREEKIKNKVIKYWSLK